MSRWRSLFPALPRSLEVRKILTPQTTWPERFPFPPEAFRREDEQADSVFYQHPRVNVHHIDDDARAAVQEHYSALIEPYNGEASVLDLMSSWTSHLPSDLKVKRLVGVGMNKKELHANPLLTEQAVLDLNQDKAELPFDDSTFDVLICSVSVDYLTRPMNVFKEVHRVLKPGGVCAMSFSNRCFPTKVIGMWLHLSDRERIYLVGSYFHYTPGFAPPESLDISPFPGKTDPMYVVQARKLPHSPTPVPL